MTATGKLTADPPPDPTEKPKRGGGRKPLPPQNKRYAITVSISYRSKQLLLRWVGLLGCHQGAIIERLIMNAYHAELAKQSPPKNSTKNLAEAPASSISLDSSPSRTLVPTRVLKPSKPRTP